MSSGVGGLAIYDVYEIKEIRDTGDSDAIVTNKFRLDTGQRDNFYDHGAIELLSGQSVTGPFDVDFKYFSHSTFLFHFPPVHCKTKFTIIFPCQIKLLNKSFYSRRRDN